MDDHIAKEMWHRANQFLQTMKRPDKRIGKDRVKIPADYKAPKSPMSFERFEQMDKEDRWSKTRFKSSKVKGSGLATITVQDPNDLDDVVLPTISIEEDEEI